MGLGYIATGGEERQPSIRLYTVVQWLDCRTCNLKLVGLDSYKVNCWFHNDQNSIFWLVAGERFQNGLGLLKISSTNSLHKSLTSRQEGTMKLMSEQKRCTCTSSNNT